MRVTQEADYAIRICCVLDEAEEILDAERIAQSAVITKSIALKVLKKLKAKGIVSSVKGANGGYTLCVSPDELSVFRIIEAIEGCVCISKCLEPNHLCSKNTNRMDLCKMHIAFERINEILKENLKSVTVRSITSPTVSTIDIIKNLK